MRKITGVFMLVLLFAISACTDKTKESQKYVREAEIYLYGSNIDKAYDLYQKAVELNPENAEAWYGIGITWLNKMKYQKAIDHFDKAIELNPGFMDAYYNRGQAYFYLGENYKACDDWKIAYDMGKPNMEDKLKKCR